MANSDDFVQSIKSIANKITDDVKRTTAVTKYRMQLAGLDRQRNEVFAKLGSRVDELRRSEQILDQGFLRLLEHEFEELDRLEKQIRQTMDSIQELNLRVEAVFEEIGRDRAEGERTSSEENLLDSFEVH